MQYAKHVSPAVADTSRGPSNAIWKDCDFDGILNDPTLGIAFHDDFDRIPCTIPTTEGNFGQYKGFSSTGGYLSDDDKIGGVMKLGSDGDNEGASIATVSLPFQISRSHGRFWGEARLYTDTIADTKHGTLFALIDACTLSATVPIAAAGTLADENFIGFHRLEGDGDYFDCVYKADGVTQVTALADAQILVADTFVKLGMKFEPLTNIFTWYGNGRPLANYTVTTTAGNPFPNDVRMGALLAMLNATATTPGKSAIDWWRFAQLFR